MMTPSDTSCHRTLLIKDTFWNSACSTPGGDRQRFAWVLQPAPRLHTCADTPVGLHTPGAQASIENCGLISDKAHAS